MPSRLFSFIALTCLSCSLHAQSARPGNYRVYGGYTYLSNCLNGVPGSRQPLNGWDVDGEFPSWHGLRFKLETYAYYGSNLGANQNLWYIMAGGQYNRKLGRETIFGEVLGGNGNAANKDWVGTGTRGELNSLTELMGGGIDTPLTRHLAYRVNFGFQHQNFQALTPALIGYQVPGTPNNFARISTGFLWKF